VKYCFFFNSHVIVSYPGAARPYTLCYKWVWQHEMWCYHSS